MAIPRFLLVIVPKVMHGYYYWGYELENRTLVIQVSWG